MKDGQYYNGKFKPIKKIELGRPCEFRNVCEEYFNKNYHCTMKDMIHCNFPKFYVSQLEGLEKDVFREDYEA